MGKGKGKNVGSSSLSELIPKHYHDEILFVFFSHWTMGDKYHKEIRNMTSIPSP